MIPILTTLSTAMCPHGGQVILATTSNTVARIQGGYALLDTDVHTVVGCPFTLGLVYHPCVTVRWSAGATQTRVNGVPVLLQSSIGLCHAANQAPQGTAIVVQAQTLARGT